MLELKDGVLMGDRSRMLMQPLSFTVAEGQVVAIGGDFRAARLLLRALLGLQPLASGHVSVDGDALLPLTANYFRQHMAYVPSDVVLSHGTMAEAAAQMFRLGVNAEMPLRRSLLMEQWRRLGIDETLYEKPLSEVGATQQWLMQLALAALLHRQMVVVDVPQQLTDEATLATVASYLRSEAFAQSAVVVATNAATLTAVCTKTVAIRPSQT